MTEYEPGSQRTSALSGEEEKDREGRKTRHNINIKRRPTTTTTQTCLTSLLLLAACAAPCARASRMGQSQVWTQSYHQEGDRPPVVSETFQEEDQGYIGCMFSDAVCNDREICFDDSLFGQCVPVDSTEDELEMLESFDDISEHDKNLLTLELEGLLEAGYRWRDVYTQCIIQNSLSAIKQRLDFDVSTCDDLLVVDPPPAYLQPMEDEEEEMDEGDGEGFFEGDSEILPYVEDAAQEPVDYDEVLDTVVPKKMLRQDPSMNDNYWYDDNSILLNQPNQDDLIQAGLLMPAYSEPASEQEILPEVYWPTNDADYPDEDLNDYDVQTNDVRKVMKRNNIQAPPAAYDTYDDDDDQPDYLYYDGGADADTGADSGTPRGTVPVLVTGGLESSLFNRNERLDVKKPGPFYQNSANNFFLDKLLSHDYESGETKKGKKNQTETSDDVGQVEYEMPLLAPSPKEKRVLQIIERPEEIEGFEGVAALPSFVHIGFKKRFDTYEQGSNLIDYLAQEFGLPDSVLTDKKIEDHHVQFHVKPNPRNVDAVQIAKRLDGDGDLKGRINSEVGVDIDRAAAGHRDDVSRVLSAAGLGGVNLLVLIVAAVSSALAVLVVGAVLLIVNKRRSRVGKLSQQDASDKEKGKAQDEYKQLCRDWSRSSKKYEGGKPESPTTKRLASNGSKDGKEGANGNGESNRSSTSSWPEEPNTTNMDISTGHMVLAYMEDHLKNKQRLEQEWVALCGYEAEPCATTIAFKAENKKKNRYPDKLPYDHNRIMLNAMVNGNGSDYVNASSVTDHDPRNPSYIVSQAPLANTVADFWQMVWEQGCVVIVMLTRLQDNGHQLCHRYWPEQGSEQYHIFEVHLVSEHIWCEDYLVRSVYLKNTRTGETRTVTQFHFRSWPADGVPTSTKALLEFRRKVNKSYRGRSCPIAVHCSDGVGRSGTYVLIDMVLNRMSKGCKEIDIAAALEHIRDQRGGMVKNRQQFEFCLMAVAEEVHAILKALPQ